MLKAAGGWRTCAGVHGNRVASAARRRESRAACLVTAMLAVSMFGANAEIARARPLEHAVETRFGAAAILTLSKPRSAPPTEQETLPIGYQYAPNADEESNLTVATTQIIPADVRDRAAAPYGVRSNWHACGSLEAQLKAGPQAWAILSPQAAIDDGRAQKGPRLTSLVSDTVLAAERDAISDVTLLDTADVVSGGASMYDPCDAYDGDAGGIETASGEPYNPTAWTAAIKTDLRSAFGGIHYGRTYRPAFALVEGAGRRAIVKINDVGPLRPGRVIDFSRQTMRYFDPLLRRGVIEGVTVTPLVGSNWTPGPLGSVPAVMVTMNAE